MQSRDERQPLHTFPNYKSEIFLYGANTGTVPATWLCSRHLHHMMFEINLVMEGTQIAEVGGVEYRQQGDELLLIPPMLFHSFKAGSPFSYFVLHVQIDDPAFLQQLTAANLLLLKRDHRLNRLLLPEVKRLMNLLEEGASRSRLFHTIYGIMDILETYMLEHGETPARDNSGGMLPLRIAKEIETLVASPIHEGDRIAGNWMAGIADKLGFSRRHIYRVFRQTYRMSPRDYLAVLRQQEAMQLLANDRGSIEQIARRVGYDNVQSFIRQFVKWTGMTPGTFRKRRDDGTIYLTPLELE